MRKLFYTVLLSLFFFSVKAADIHWLHHPIFSEETEYLVETPAFVYFTSANLPQNSDSEPYLSLFRYDKKGEELKALSASNILNGIEINQVAYNPAKGYLAVLYKDNNLDLLYDNGKVVNIPGLARTNLSGSKDVNHISVDKDNDRLYLATNFGYVSVNDKKQEIAESGIFYVPFLSFARVGNRYLAIRDKELLAADTQNKNLSLNDFSNLATLDYPAILYPVSANECLILSGDTKTKIIKKYIIDEGGERIEDLTGYITINNVTNTGKGVIVGSQEGLYLFAPEGMSRMELPEEYRNSSAVTMDMAEVWTAEKWKGLNRIKYNGEEWRILNDRMLPNTPATFATTSFVQHPTYGFMMLSNGYVPSTLMLYSFAPLQISSLKQGRWSNHAPAFYNPERANILEGANGIAIDPDNNKYVYIASYHSGLVRLNLENPNDIIHLSDSEDPDFGKEGFVVWDDRPANITRWANISPPYFDAAGNLWMVKSNTDRLEGLSPIQYYCWTSENRKATTSADNIRMPQTVEFNCNMPFSNFSVSIPLKHTGKGLMVYANSKHDENIVLIDTNNTPLETSDDTLYEFPEFIDSDGNSLEVHNIKYLWEDPSTGYVWVCHNNGVFYFSPAQVRTGNYTLHRVKVSRNDGTNLADYLLDGVTVNHLVADSQGRKWFALADGGVVCTSADGRQILEEFDTENSPLPSDELYAIGYNSDNNSLMMSTSKGYVEYTLPSAVKNSGKVDIKAYPNPVRPDFSGYVTITEIPQGSMVKITDVAGNLVKDLGVMTGSEILWDVADSNFNRVKSGVYHIMVSPSDDSSSFKGVGKILVMN